MKHFKYFLIALLAFAATSCVEEPILKGDGDDDPIVNPPPPKPKMTASVEMVSLNA